MQEICSELIQIKGKGAPAARMKALERKVAAYSGVCMKVHDNVNRALDELFHLCTNTATTRIGASFDEIHNKLPIICDETEAKTEEDKAMEKILQEKLKENVQEVKRTLDKDGEIAKLVEESKTYHSQTGKGASELFVQ